MNLGKYTFKRKTEGKWDEIPDVNKHALRDIGE
jgi:hypothetical protein